MMTYKSERIDRSRGFVVLLGVAAEIPREIAVLRT